ncbi:MAG: D-alanyl-D-alanine carboxypeptidase [Clostridiales bacterium]|nr:D-alanyl-D-alanine carboxypeptidase [Clostridiales bacterium]
MKSHITLPRLMSFLLLFLLLIPCISSAAPKPTATPPIYPEATLDPDSAKYDAEHPENLEPNQLYAWSAILMESVSGDIIFEKSADTPRFPASTTKIMTCYLGITMVEDLDMTVTVSQTAVDVPADSSTMKLQAGEELSFRDVLYGTMLLSANDGANVIAETVSGSIPEFVNLMNQTAYQMGCTSTHFNNAHGYTDPSHYTTAHDLAIMARYAMQNDLFREIVATQTYSLPKTNLSRSRTMTNTNELFNAGTEEKPNKYYYPDSIGIKTGNTDASQYCFVGGALRDGVELISVVMYTGKRARWADTIKLMDYGFSQYMSVTPIDLYNMNPITIETSSYSTNDTNMGKLRLNCIATNASLSAKAVIVKRRAVIETLAQNLKSTVLIQYTRDFKAPITVGETIGTMTFLLEDGTPVVYNLVASRTVAARENIPRTIEQIWEETYADPNPYPPLNSDFIVFAFGITAFVTVMGWSLHYLLLRKKRKGGKVPDIKSRYLK